MDNHLWEEIVKEIEQESDPIKVEELGRKLNEAMIAEGREKVKNRLGIAADQSIG